MTATAALEVRVMVTEAWDTVTLSADPATAVSTLKRQALTRALGSDAHADSCAVKFRGGLVTDEGRSLADLGVPDGGSLIVLPARRHPVR